MPSSWNANNLQKTRRIQTRCKEFVEYRSKRKNKLSKSKKSLQKKRQELRNKIRQLNRTEAARDHYYQQQGIQRYSKKAKWTLERILFKNKVNHYRTAIRSKKKTITNLQKPN